MTVQSSWTAFQSRVLNRAVAPIVAVAATVIVSGLGIHGLTGGANALQSALRSTSSAHELETIAAGVQGINGNLYHVLTLRGAQTKGFDAAAELHPLLLESDRITAMLRTWRDTRATPAQKPRVSALIDSLKLYRGAVDFVTEMLDVDFVAAVSFIQPFDKNFHDLMQSLNTLVHEVQQRESTDANAALTTAATTVRAFEVVVGGCILLALLAAADAARNAVRSHRLSRQNSQLAQLAQVDALTGLGNRRCFDETMASVWAECTASQTPITLVMFDIDHFKKFNDSQGHPAGDACLKTVGGAVSGCTRGGRDLVARYGGEEFAIILPGAVLEAGLSVAERVRQAVLRSAIPHPAAGPPGIVTVSLGVACRMPTATGRHDMLIEAADRGLYAAKRAGRNQVGVFDSSKTEESLVS